MSKIYKNAKEALSDIKSNSSIMSGGFGLCGIAENCITRLSKMPISNLTIISNNIGNSGRGLVALLKQHKISTAYCSYIGGNPDLEKQLLSKEITVHLIPQGTFAERIRAAGCGIPAFYTPTGYGTEAAFDEFNNAKEIKTFNNINCILETSLDADFAIIKAQKGDHYGNLWFKESARNFSPLMAMAAKTTIVEVEELVELGEIKAEDVHLPGVFVQRIFQGNNYKNDIEYLTIS